MRRRRENGFTLIELLVVVAIIGVIAAIAIPNMLVAMNRAKQRRTMVDMRNLAAAWEARNTEASRYNAAGQTSSLEGANQLITYDNLNVMLSPTFIRIVPRNDAWGTPFQSYADQGFGDAKVAKAYAIMSAGRDGVVQADPTKGAFTNFDCDIVYSNGVFLSYPDGVTLNK